MSERVQFDWIEDGPYSRYECESPGNRSGEYVPAEDYDRLAEAAKALLTWYDDARSRGHGYNPAGEMDRLRAALNPPAPEDSTR